MTETFDVTTDAALIESIVERGFDPALSIGREEFLELLHDAEELDRAGRRALPAAITRMGEQLGETGSALTLPVAVGYRRLLRLMENSTVSCEDQAITDALSTLVRRLVTTLQQTVQFEAAISRSARFMTGDHSLPPEADQPLLGAWLDRWRMFPVLASLVTLILVNWLRSVEEVVRALERDHAELATALTGTTTPLAIRAITGDAGDPHLGGRSVMILTFADGARVVFKPKQLAITDVFRSLVERINAAGFTTELRVHDALVRDTHTWERFVPHRSCTSTVEVERFYRRMGGWIRLLQMVEGRDFWLDNLIADGEYPVFIDLETIMQPRRVSIGMTGSAARVQDRIESSPIVTNIVAMFAPIGPDVGSEDLGCFATPGDFLSPFAATDIPGVTAAGSNRDGYRTWTHPEHAPLLDGEPMTADRWYPAIEAGYREMGEALDALAPELLAPDGWVDRLCAQPVRTIYRDTWTCLGIIHRSTAPPLLGNYRRRRKFLERMELEAKENVTRIGPVVAAEMRAMIALDVPFFSALGSGDTIYPPDGEAVSGFFDGAARDHVVANLHAQSQERLEEDVALLRTSFWTAHPGAAPRTVVATGGATPSIERTAWSDAASRIADQVVAARTVADDGTSSWIALTYHPTVDIEAWSPIGNDLLTGRAGLVTCFIDQWRTSGDDRWRVLAIDAALEVAGTIHQVTRAWQADPTAGITQMPDSPVVLGAFTGLGGMLATVKLAFDTFGERALEGAWRDTLAGVDWEAVLARSSHDVVGGSAGLALALTARQEWIDQLPHGLRQMLERIACSEEVGNGTTRPPGTAAKLAALPGERVAQLLIRSRLDSISDGELQDRIRAVLDSIPTAGDMLGVIELSGPDVSWWPRLSQRVADTVAKRESAADRVMQIEAAELALAMWRASGDARWHERASAIGELWIAGFNESGSWFPNDLADDRFRLSTVRGIPAIASVLRRIGGAPVVAGPLTLDWRSWGRR